MIVIETLLGEPKKYLMMIVAVGRLILRDQDFNTCTIAQAALKYYPPNYGTFVFGTIQRAGGYTPFFFSSFKGRIPFCYSIAPAPALISRQAAYILREPFAGGPGNEHRDFRERGGARSRFNIL